MPRGTAFFSSRPSAAPQAYAVLPSAAALPRAMALLEQLRERGIAVQMHAGGGGMKRLQALLQWFFLRVEALFNRGA